MPCYDPSSSDEALFKRERNERKRIEAMLCAILTAAKTHIDKPDADKLLIESIDEKESGLTKRAITDWWTEHQAEDAERHRLRAPVVQQNPDIFGDPDKQPKHVLERIDD